VLIKADANTTTKDVISVLQAARTAGIENVALATQIPTKKWLLQTVLRLPGRLGFH
jgi:hypothetical protein